MTLDRNLNNYSIKGSNENQTRSLSVFMNCRINDRSRFYAGENTMQLFNNLYNICLTILMQLCCTAWCIKPDKAMVTECHIGWLWMRSILVKSEILTSFFAMNMWSSNSLHGITKNAIGAEYNISIANDVLYVGIHSNGAEWWYAEGLSGDGGAIGEWTVSAEENAEMFRPPEPIHTVLPIHQRPRQLPSVRRTLQHVN